MTMLDELAAALPEYSPVVKTFDGVPRLLLTLSPSETVELYGHPLEYPYHCMEGVYMDPLGVTHRRLLGVVYGIALLPVMVAEYAAIRERQNR